MACPYCGSGDWEVLPTMLGTKVEKNGAGITFLCECRECGRMFATEEWYRLTDFYTCRELTKEEEMDGTDGE